jgi:hypothetical protein
MEEDESTSAIWVHDLCMLLVRFEEASTPALFVSVDSPPRLLCLLEAFEIVHRLLTMELLSVADPSGPTHGREGACS